MNIKFDEDKENGVFHDSEFASKKDSASKDSASEDLSVDDWEDVQSDIVRAEGHKSVSGFGWYVIKVVAGRELPVSRSLNDLLANKMKVKWFDSLFVPSEHVARTVKGKQHVVNKVMWPGYLVARLKFSSDARKTIKSVTGVLDFIGGIGAVPLSPEETEYVMSLKTKKDSGEIVVDPAQFKVGDSVVVRWGDGVGNGNLAKVLDVYSNKNGDKVLVEIFAFGREVKMEVDASRVELDLDK